jgi:hypothetical protein
LPADEAARLFQKYFRGRIAQHQPGAGRSLYLVQRIVALHGGKVTLDSAELDGAISFSLHIPAWRVLYSRLNQSGIAQICSLINPEILLHSPEEISVAFCHIYVAQGNRDGSVACAACASRAGMDDIACALHVQH